MKTIIVSSIFLILVLLIFANRNRWDNHRLEQVKVINDLEEIPIWVQEYFKGDFQPNSIRFGSSGSENSYVINFAFQLKLNVDGSKIKEFKQKLQSKFELMELRHQRPNLSYEYHSDETKYRLVISAYWDPIVFSY